MKHIIHAWMMVLVCIIALMAFNGAQHPAVGQSGQVVQIRNCQEFDRYIKSGRAVVAYFSSLTCGPCKAFHDTLYAIAEANSDIPFISITEGVCQNASGLMNKYVVRSYPTFMFFDKSGNKVNQITGVNENTRSKIEVELQKLRTGASSAVPQPAPVQMQQPMRQPAVQQPQRMPVQQQAAQQPKPKPGHVIMIQQPQPQNVQPVVTHYKKSSMAGAVNTEPMREERGGRSAQKKQPRGPRQQGVCK